MKLINPFSLRASCGLAAIALVACSGKADLPQATTAPAVTVTTVPARQRDLPVVLTATGTVIPLTTVDIKAQVNSVVDKVHIRDGQFVKAGELLFTLDSRADEANLAKARAQLAKDNAALADAQRQLVRAQQLLAQNFVSQGAVDTAQTQVDAARATGVADQAAIDASRVALSYDRVTAPNAGRAEPSMFHQGAPCRPT